MEFTERHTQRPLCGFQIYRRYVCSGSTTAFMVILKALLNGIFGARRLRQIGSVAFQRAQTILWPNQRAPCRTTQSAVMLSSVATCSSGLDSDQHRPYATLTRLRAMMVGIEPNPPGDANINVINQYVAYVSHFSRTNSRLPHLRNLAIQDHQGARKTRQCVELRVSPRVLSVRYRMFGQNGM